MITDLVAVYQFLCALFVTLCFDRIFRNFVWRKGTFGRILNQTQVVDFDFVKSKKFKDEICGILAEKYNSFFEHSKIFSFLNLIVCFTFLFLSSCSYWKAPIHNETLLYHLAQVLIIYNMLVMILFCLFRKLLFGSRCFFSIMLTSLIVIVSYYYYLMLSAELPFIIVEIDINKDVFHGLISSFSLLIFLPPFIYFYLHNLLFPKVYGLYIKEKLKVESYMMDAKIADLCNGANTSGDTGTDVAAAYSQYAQTIEASLKNTLNRNELMGILWQSIMLAVESLYRWFTSKFKIASDFIVGVIALTCRYGRYVKYIVFKKNKK